MWQTIKCIFNFHDFEDETVSISKSNLSETSKYREVCRVCKIKTDWNVYTTFGPCTFKVDLTHPPKSGK